MSRTRRSSKLDAWLSNSPITAATATVAVLALLGLAYKLLQLVSSNRRRHFVAQRRAEYFDSTTARRPDPKSHSRVQRRTLPSQPSSSSSSRNSDNWLFSPPRYLPPSQHLDLVLGLREAIKIRDGGFQWQPATALLDTGNQHLTIVQPAYAARHSLYNPSEGGLLAQPDSWTTLRGVVPGATSRAPVITIRLSIREHEFTVSVAVSELGANEDVLLGLDVLEQLFALGFRISKV